MKSRAHAAISLVVAGLALAVTNPPVPAVVVVVGLVAVSLYAHVLADLVATERETVVLDPDDPRLE